MRPILLTALLLALAPGCSSEAFEGDITPAPGLSPSVEGKVSVRGYYDSGALQSEAEYRDGVKHGVERWYSEDGVVVHELHWLRGARDGIARFWDVDGNFLGESDLSGGEGHLEFYYPAGPLWYEVPVVAGQFHGERTYYYLSGDVWWTEVFSEGELHGNKTQFYGDGTVFGEYEYSEGLLDGVSRTYWENGQLGTEEHHQAGLLHGSRRVWTEAGRPTFEEHYRDDLLEGERLTWYPSGNPGTRHHFLAGLRHGTHEQFWDSPQMSPYLKATYDHGRPVGTARHYFESGALYSETTFNENGQRTYYRYYTETGELAGSCFYVDGQKNRCSTYN